MNLEEAKRFAEHWVAAWNSHDIDQVLSHYTDDFEMTTPMIQRFLGTETGTLKGKVAVGDYWRTALKKVPDLKFQVIEITSGVNSVSIYYNAVMGKRAVEPSFSIKKGRCTKP